MIHLKPFFKFMDHLTNVLLLLKTNVLTKVSTIDMFLPLAGECCMAL